MSKTIEFKATGETITFTKSGQDTDGKMVETIVTLPSSGEGPPLHRHVLQTEYFEAIEGRLGLKVGDTEMILEPGQSYTVPPNTLHRCYAVDNNEIKFKAVFTPALHIEYFLTEIFESCNRKQSKDPSPFDASYIMNEVQGEYYLGDVPILVQKHIFPVIAWIGKTLGLVNAKSKNDYL